MGLVFMSPGGTHCPFDSSSSESRVLILRPSSRGFLKRSRLPAGGAAALPRCAATRSSSLCSWAPHFGCAWVPAGIVPQGERVRSCCRLGVCFNLLPHLVCPGRLKHQQCHRRRPCRCFDSPRKQSLQQLGLFFVSVSSVRKLRNYKDTKDSLHQRGHH